VHEARRLMRMVDNVLHFARTSEGRVQLEIAPADLGPLVESIATTFVPLAEERGSHVVTEVRESVVANVDSGAVRQIVLNLLDNALKFGPPGQTVRLIVDCVDTRARLAVEDKGPGIPVVDRSRIWSPYVRLRRGKSVAHEGSGIGLAVVRELTALHRGVTYVEDAADGGARVVVELPIGATHESADVSAPKRPRARDRSMDGVERRRWTSGARWRPRGDSNSANRS
jgi:signal transduction histidine kinase